MALLRVTFNLLHVSGRSASHLLLAADTRFPQTFDWACPAFASSQGKWSFDTLNPGSTQQKIICETALPSGIVSVAELYRLPAPWQPVANRQTFHVGDRGEAYLVLNNGQPPDFTWTIVFSRLIP